MFLFLNKCSFLSLVSCSIWCIPVLQIRMRRKQSSAIPMESTHSLEHFEYRLVFLLLVRTTCPWVCPRGALSSSSFAIYIKDAVIRLWCGAVRKRKFVLVTIPRDDDLWRNMHKHIDTDTSATFRLFIFTYVQYKYIVQASSFPALKIKK